MPVSTTIPAGTVISGKYRVSRELGRGGMAAVYEAMNLNIHKRVAIKLLAGHLTTSQTVVERFLREARAVAQIRSPHICDVYDAGKLDDGTPYLVLELLEGESLYEAMVRDRQMSTGLTLAIILQVCRGLGKAHETQIVHRDLKPENIFLTVDDDEQLLVKVLDFGLAKFYDPTSTAEVPARLTREGAVFGTPVYMSPEQVRGQAAADHRADLWALACITYECLTGTTVWSTDEGVAMTFAQIATAPLPDPMHYRPDLPQTFKTWYKRALDRDIDKRFQNVGEFANSLAETFDYELKSGSLHVSLVTQVPRGAKRKSAPDRGDAPTADIPRNTTPLPALPRTAGSSESSDKTLKRPWRPKRPSAASEPMSLRRAVIDTLPPRIPRLVINGRLVAASVIASLLVVLVVWSAVSGKDPEPPAKLKRISTVMDKLLSSSNERTAGLHLVSHHPWLPRIREAQMRIARNEPERAELILRRIAATHRHAMIDNLRAQVAIAIAAKRTGSRCQITGYARPRRSDLLNANIAQPNGTTAPTIVTGIDGPIIAWGDIRDGKRRAYAVPLDNALRNRALPVDFTPEANYVHAPTLIPVAKRFLAGYWDSRGRTPGVYLRWLRSTGVIDTPALLVSSKNAGSYDAHVARDAKGGFIVAWAEQRERDSVDLMLRRFTAELKPRGGPIRVTDFVKLRKQLTRVGHIRVTTSDRWIHTAYLVTEGTARQLRYQTLPISLGPPGLQSQPPHEGRTLGDEQTITAPEAKAGAPSLACAKDGCFLTWHRSHQGGAGVAFIDAASRKVQWHKLFSPSGRYPSLGVSPKGDVQLVWVEANQLTTASLGREGVGPRSQVARVSSKHAVASISPGAKRGEWYLGWLDRESNRAEPYAARMQCR